MKPLRIQCWTHDLSPYGGAQRCLLTVARGLAAAGHRLDVQAPADGPLSKEYQAAGIGVRIGPQTLWPGIDLLLAESAWEGRQIVSMAHAAGVPCVWYVLESNLSDIQKQDPLGTELFRACARVVFTSENVRRLYRDEGLLEASSAIVIPDAVDIAHVDAEVAATNRRSMRTILGAANGRLVLNMGSLWPLKAQMRLVRAAAHTSGVQYAILGRDFDGPYGREIRREISRLKLERWVTLCPPTLFPIRAIASADLICQTSKHESMPRVLLEAMAARTPIVTTAVGGIPEMIRDGEEGVFVDAEDAEALASALTRLLADADEGRRFAENARRRVEEEFRLEVQWERWKKLVEEL